MNEMNLGFFLIKYFFCKKNKDTGKTAELNFLVKNITEPTVGMYDFLGEDKGKKKYIAVQIWVKNISGNELKLPRADFKLFDQEDAKYVEVTEFVDKRKSPMLFPEKMESDISLKANQAKSGWVTFITSNTSKATKIVYNNVTVKL